MRFEYKVVPAPTKGVKAKGVKLSQDRFANALQALMNEYGAKGWEYLRTDTLPSEEREGLIGKTTVYQNMLVFCRMADQDDDDAETQEDVTPLPVPIQRESSPRVEPVVTPIVAKVSASDKPATPDDPSNPEKPPKTP